MGQGGDMMLRFIQMTRIVSPCFFTIIAFPAAVNFDFVQKSGGFGSDPQPQAPLVMSLYLQDLDNQYYQI